MNLFIGLIISTIGLSYFGYGKKEADFNFMIFGLVLIVYPYFTQNVFISLLLGAVFLAAPFITRRFF